jgi:hypothetical protein
MSNSILPTGLSRPYRSFAAARPVVWNATRPPPPRPVASRICQYESGDWPYSSPEHPGGTPQAETQIDLICTSSRTSSPGHDSVRRPCARHTAGLTTHGDRRADDSHRGYLLSGYIADDRQGHSFAESEIALGNSQHVGIRARRRPALSSCRRHGSPKLTDCLRGVCC